MIKTNHPSASIIDINCPIKTIDYRAADCKKEKVQRARTRVVTAFWVRGEHEILLFNHCHINDQN